MGSKVVILMSFISLLAISLMIVVESPGMGIVAILLAGLAFAPIFPTIVGITFSKFDSSLYGSIYGLIFSFGLLGGTFVPKVVGSLSVGSTVQHSLIITAVMAAFLLIVSLFIGHVGRKPGKE